jgi:hypothetical protein
VIGCFNGRVESREEKDAKISWRKAIFFSFNFALNFFYREGHAIERQISLFQEKDGEGKGLSPLSEHEHEIIFLCTGAFLYVFFYLSLLHWPLFRAV